MCTIVTKHAYDTIKKGEAIPPGWICIENTPCGFPADLNHGSIRSPEIFICYKRGRDKAPLVDVGVLYEGKERVMADSEVVYSTLLGKAANVNNSGSRTFLTYRRAKANAPCNQLVVMDICVILMNKGENPPHAFCLVQKNLNKGMVGSDVYLCYKKSMNRPPLLRYQPEILGRYPMQDYPGYSLPESVPLFCMPMGATIESWPKKCQQPRPVFSTFVLTSDTAVKVYGAAVTFYESYPSSKLTREEKELLEYETEKEEDEDKSLNAVKSICILSRWPFFDTFEKFLLFLYKSMANSMQKPLSLPIEMFISHFMLEVPFPSSQRPKILVQLISTSDETVLISQPPEDMPLPLSGASFSQMLRNLGPDNCLNVLLLALSEQKMLLHSLRPDVLTGVAEAVTSIMFPFHWQCPYIPLCPLGLCDVLNAPLPFIVGVDSRYFDLFVPPVDVACVDLDTNSIYLSESKKSLNQKALPKRPARILKATLEEIFQRLVRPQVMCNGSGNSGGAYSGQSVKRGSTAGYSIDSISVKKFERQIDLEIQEAFVRFMSSCLKDFRSYLRPITRAPSVGATDPSSLFDLSGFLKSRDKNYQRFYQILMRTQMFARFIEERSFVSDKNISLAFFDECLDKIETVPDADSSATLKFLDPDDTLKNDRTVFIPAPESSPDQKSEFSYKSFGPLDVSLFHAHPVMKSRLSLINNQNHHSTIDELSSPTKSTSASAATIESPMSRRTKQEIRMSQRIAKRHAESPLTWAKCLVSYVYSLWFIHLPAYFKMIQSRDQSSSSTKESSLRLALEVLMRMQSLNLHPPDEICYRVLMLMCGEYSQPALAVKVLFEMRQNGVIPNAITYGYYNKAVLESKWPAGDTTAALLWSRLRNVVTGVHRFKKMGQERQEKFAKLNAAKEALIQGFNKSSNRTDVTTVGGTGAQQVQVMTPGNTTSDDVSSVESDFVKTESGSNDLGYCSTTTQEIITPEKPLLNIKRESVDDSVIHRKNPDAVDFSESNAFRIKTRSIVRQSSNASVTITTGLQEYDSPAGVLMTSSPSSLLNDDVFSSPESVTRRQNSARRSSKTRSLQSSDVPTPESSSSTGDKKETTEGTSRPYLRSYSFGSDTKIIKKLKEGTLKALKHELERNHQMVPEEDLQTDQPASTDVAQKSVTQKSSDEALVKSSQESVQNKTDDSDISQEIIMTTVTPLKTNRSASVDSQVKNQRAHSSDDILTSTLTPIKDAIGNYTGNLFSPEGKVASSFKSGFKFASRLASPTKTATGSRAKMASFSLIRSKTLTERDEPPNSRTAALTRSATLPAGVDGTSCINEMLSVDIKETDVENQKPDEVEKSDKSSEKSSVGSTETMEKIGDKLSVTGVSSSSSPWSNRLSGKHFEYLKSATNSMVNRISEIKSNLSTPGKPSSTSTSSSVTGSTAGTGSSFLSQWASLVAEKLPSNFSLEDDDDSSLSSFEMRRGSLALSEEDLGSCETCRSREGSSSHATHHLKSAQPSAAIPFFEMLEGHYSDILGEPKSDDVLIQIEMTSCCRCYSCSSLLFDEEIMSGWTPDDSNLNTQCVHCNSKFVPLLTIVLKVCCVNCDVMYR